MTWRKVKINRNNIERETEKAVLIALPKQKEFAGYSFWHPKRLVREMERGNGHWLSVSFTDDWEFKIKNGDEYDYLESDDIISQFGIIDGSKTFSEESYLHVKEPEPIKKKVEVDESLKR